MMEIDYQQRSTPNDKYFFFFTICCFFFFFLAALGIIELTHYNLHTYVPSLISWATAWGYRNHYFLAEYLCSGLAAGKWVGHHTFCYCAYFIVLDLTSVINWCLVGVVSAWRIDAKKKKKSWLISSFIHIGEPDKPSDCLFNYFTFWGLQLPESMFPY